MEEPSQEQSQEQSVEQPQEDSAKRSSGRILLIVGLAVVVLAGAAGFLFLRRAKAATSRAEETPAPTEVKAVLHLETFTVNMNDPEQKTYLRIGIDLGLASAPKGGNKGAAPTALVRDTILDILMAAKPEEVMTAEGKKQLKQRLLEALQKRAPELEVNEVYFTEFLMQR
jgi:flagellar basal body-associated protein FliL